MRQQVSGSLMHKVERMMDDDRTPAIATSSCVPSAAEISAVAAVLRSGLLRQGPSVERLEREFCARFGARHAVACASGTAALHLAYQSLLCAGDEVLVPALTFVATASMAIAAQAVPVACDVDADTWLIDLRDAERRITPRTRAIAPVHLFGNCCDRAAIERFARRHGLAVVWDAAQAHGARWRGQDVAAWSPLVCFSFYATKNLFTGEGGMVCTDDAALAAALRSRRSHGQDADGRWQELGFNYRLGDVPAALGLAQLSRFDAMAERRQRNADRLRRGLAGIPGIRCQTITIGCEPAWHRFCVTVDEDALGVDRDGLAAHLAARNIATSVHYPRGIHQEPFFVRRFGCTSLPVSERIGARILALPVHHDLGDEDIDRIISEVRRCHRSECGRR
ncbi:MAG: DegT/DnrJ/EryC1/StrS family aminotransferase [Hyphomonadaceae bacterium]|nr:DegT/DnrJ/EryC1/StrS family aminotransferase [Hyphomonadaceae bacterium]